MRQIILRNRRNVLFWNYESLLLPSKLTLEQRYTFGLSGGPMMIRVLGGTTFDVCLSRKCVGLLVAEESQAQRCRSVAYAVWSPHAGGALLLHPPAWKSRDATGHPETLKGDQVAVYYEEVSNQFVGHQSE